MSASSMASRRAGGCCASTSASACGSTAARAATTAMTPTTLPTTASSLRRRSSGLAPKARPSSNCRSASTSASMMFCSLRTEVAARSSGLAAERRRPHRSALSSSSSSSSTTKAGAFGLGKGGISDSKKKKGPVVVIDNYDSFTYNLCQYLGNLGCDYVVVANDACTVAEIAAMNPAGVLVSPGPGAPEESGISLQAVAELGPRFPLFGVCMGHQCIGRAFGGDVVRAPGGVMHGKTSPVAHSGVGLLRGLPSPFLAARYHSLVIDAGSCPDCLEVTARTQGDDGVIMAVRHRDYPWVQGVQFHPESIITDGGMIIVKNFVDSLAAGATRGAVEEEQGKSKVGASL